jgi:tetratricopeptide (TPR) repeat protein
VTRLAAGAALLLLVVATAAADQPAGQASERERLLSQADAALAAGRRDEATQLFATAATKHESVRAMLQLAKLQAGAGDRAGSLKTLQKARSLAPNSEEVLSTFAQVSLGAGAVMPAASVLRNLTHMCPTVAQYHYLLGVALMLAGDMPDAHDALLRADQLEPGKAQTLVALGLALNSRKMYADAKPYLLRGLELEPENIDAMAALAESEEGVGEMDQADAHVQRVLSKAPNHANANLVLGLLLMQRNAFAEARDALLKSVAAQPNLARAYYQLSLAYARLGDDASSAKALEQYRQAQRDIEVRVDQIRTETGMPSRGG